MPRRAEVDDVTRRGSAQKGPHHETRTPFVRVGMHAEHRMRCRVAGLEQRGQVSFGNNHAEKQLAGPNVPHAQGRV